MLLGLRLPFVHTAIGYAAVKQGHMQEDQDALVTGALAPVEAFPNSGGVVIIPAKDCYFDPR
jgi:hypothetical protein